MLITRKSIVSGIVRTLNIPVEPWELMHYNMPQRSTDKVKHECNIGSITKPHKVLIQEAFPDLIPDDREFLMTGISLDEWKEFVEKNEN